MEILHQRCAGFDVSKNDVKVCVRVQQSDGGAEYSTTTWGATTRQILALRDFLIGQQVSTVFLESTGNYWKPFYYLLEDQLDPVLVNARQSKHVPGRKSDVSDAAWLADLGAHGLLRGSFVPPKPIRELRDLTRARVQVSRDQHRQLERIDAVLQGAGIKLSSVVSDLTGKSAWNIMRAMIAGITDPEQLADLAIGKLRPKVGQLVEALESGRFGDHQRFMLQIQLDGYERLQTDLDRLEDRIEGLMAPFQGRVEQLISIPGISTGVAQVIIAETGGDLSVFPSPDQLASWAGVAPGKHQSAKRERNVATVPGNKHLERALGIAVMAILRGKKDNYLKARYRRIAKHRGAARAMVALQRSLIVIIWHMFRDGTHYHDLGAEYETRRRARQAFRTAVKTFHDLGINITIDPSQAAAVA